MSEAAAAIMGDGGGSDAPPAGGTGGGDHFTVPDWAKDWEPEVGAWAGKKGYKTPGDVAKGYFNLEKTWGADKAGRAIALPGENAGPEEWDQVYDRLGRPKDPTGYGLEAAEGHDPRFAEVMAGAFHKAGLSPDQAGTVFDALKELAEEATGGEARAARNKADHDEIRREWGPSYEQGRALAGRASRAMGLSPEDLDTIENALGTKFVFEKFRKLGEALREDAGVGEVVQRQAEFASPAAAQGKLDELLNDKGFMAKVQTGDRAANAQIDALFKAAASA